MHEESDYEGIKNASREPGERRPNSEFHTLLFSVLVVVVEASAPKVYPRVTLAGVITLSGSVVRTLGGGEGLPKMFCLVASSLGHLLC